MESKQNRRKQLKEKLEANIDYSIEHSDEQMQEMIDEMLVRESKEVPMTLAERNKLRKELFHAIRKLDVLQELVDDPYITEIMINGPECIFIERDGRLFQSELCFDSQEKLENIIQQIVEVEKMRERKEKHLKGMREFLREEEGMGTVEIILIIVEIFTLIKLGISC